ncbi:MAG: phosphoenolpyruvate---glycerone phosphotransferase subunit DhaL [Actinomycetota bacterium]|nr:phosphoenolpyruvate---glycerone phosphotransferase subunit DhaL [Actinomycetota bacterium]
MGRSGVHAGAVLGLTPPVGITAPGWTTDTAAAWVRACARVIAANRNYLTALDAAIGDADHGTNMDRGFAAAVEKLDETPTGTEPSAVLRLTGMALLSTIGGASGPLYGTFFVRMSKACESKAELGLGDWAEALDAGVEGVVFRGRAESGDKTMVDALLPARDALRAAAKDGLELAAGLAAAAAAAEEGMRATTPMVAKKGRASYLGDRSAGNQDPGATSAYLLLKAAADVWR